MSGRRGACGHAPPRRRRAKCRTCGRLAGIRSVAIARYGLPPTRLCGVVVIRGDVPAWYLALSRYHAEHAAGWQASGVSYRAMHRAIGFLFHPRRLSAMGAIVLSGVSYRAVVLSGGSSHQRRPAGIRVSSRAMHRAISGVSYQAPAIPPAVGLGVSYRAMHRAIGALMRPCAGRLHRRRTACAVSRMHVRGGAGAVCRNGINRAAVGVSYQAPVIPPAVGRELVCCWVGLRASAHLARAVMLIHCAAIDLDCIAKGMASIG